MNEHLRLLTDHPVDDPSPDDLRARYESAWKGCLVVADTLSEQVLGNGDPAYVAALALSYRDVRETARRLKAWLAEVE